MTCLVFIAILLALVGARLFVGVPRSDPPAREISAGELAFLRAAAATFVPSEPGGLARGGDAVDLAAFVDRYLGGLPVHQRRRIRAMLVFFEHATLAFPARGLGGFRRFSSLDDAQRRAWLESWATSRAGWRRALLTALRAFVVMGVMSDAENLRALGLAPWERIASPTIDADLLYPAVGAPRASIDRTEADVTPLRDVSPLRRSGDPT